MRPGISFPFLHRVLKIILAISAFYLPMCGFRNSSNQSRINPRTTPLLLSDLLSCIDVVAGDLRHTCSTFSPISLAPNRLGFQKYFAFCYRLHQRPNSSASTQSTQYSTPHCLRDRVIRVSASSIGHPIHTQSVMATLSREEEEEIAEYDKIIAFHDRIMSGNPTIKPHNVSSLPL